MNNGSSRASAPRKAASREAIAEVAARRNPSLDLRLVKTASPLEMGITAEFLQGLQEAVAIGNDGGARALNRIGACWGHAWLSRLIDHAATHVGLDIRMVSVEDVLSLVSAHFESLGWGSPRFDFETHADVGLMLVVIAGSPASLLRGGLGDAVGMLQAGFFGGVFSAISELPIEAYSFKEVQGNLEVVHVAMCHKSEIARVRSVWEAGGSLKELLRNRR